MAVAVVTPATGQLAAAAAAIFTATGDCFVNVSLVNTDASARAVNLYVNTGTRRKFLSVSLGAGSNWPGAGRPYGPIFLKNGHTIDGDAATANVVDYAVTGASL